MSQATRILLSLVSGLLIGIALVPVAARLGVGLTEFTQPVGLAWLHGLQMVIVPLTVGLLVTGVGAAADAARAGKLALRAVLTMVVILWATTILSAIVTPLLLN